MAFTGLRAAVPISERKEDWRCPVKKGAKIIQGNGGEVSHNDVYNRYAWDYGCPINTPIVASRNGIVSFCRINSNIGGPDRKFLDDANQVRITHPDGTVSVYFHLSKNMSMVRKGEYVLQGELIGYSGTTGFSFGPHLHYTVFKGGISTETHFEDFRKSDGIPQKGDFHGPARPPAVPQVVIQEYKKYYRAVKAAEQNGWPDIGLALLKNSPVADKRSNYSSYHYHAVLLKLQSQFQHDVDRTAAELVKKELLSSEELFLLKRFLESLKSVRGAEKFLTVSRKKIKDISSSRIRESGITSTATRSLVKGRMYQCFEEPLKAGGAYLAAMRKSHNTYKVMSRDLFRQLVDSFNSSFSAEFERLKDEAERCREDDRKKVKADADKVAKKAIALAREWKKYLPEDSRRAEKILGLFEENYRFILDKVK